MSVSRMKIVSAGAIGQMGLVKILKDLSKDTGINGGRRWENGVDVIAHDGQCYDGQFFFFFSRRHARVEGFHPEIMSEVL